MFILIIHVHFHYSFGVPELFGVLVIDTLVVRESCFVIASFRAAKFNLRCLCFKVSRLGYSGLCLSAPLSLSSLG